MSIRSIVVLLVVTLTLSCGATDAAYDPDSEGEPRGPTLGSLERDLSLGSRGDDVRAVHDYLTRFGYFPNAELARKYPAWRPIVPETPLAQDVFDERTAEAIRRLQINGGLRPTAIVDAATREML